MSRTRVRQRRLALLATAAVVAGFWAGPVARALDDGVPAAVPVSHRSYVVRPGDTLWSIAGEIAAPGGDRRPVVDQIAAANQVEAGALVPGQTLMIPAAG